MDFLTDMDKNILVFLVAVFYLLAVGQTICVCFLVSRREVKPASLAIAYETMLIAHLLLSAAAAYSSSENAGGSLIGLSVAHASLEALFWANAFVLILGLMLRRPCMVIELATLLTFTPPVIAAIGNLWWYVFVFDAAFFLFRVSTRLVFNVRHSSSFLSRFAVIDALNVLPEGVLYADSQGTVRFMNDSMRACLQSLGLPTDIAGTNGLWAMLQAKASMCATPNAPLSEGVQLLVNEQDIRLFVVSKVRLRKQPHQLILALDVTEEERLNLSIEQTCHLLEKAGVELQKSLDNLRETAENEALSQMRLRMHDIVGQRLSILHRYLEDDCVSATSLESIQTLLNTILKDLTTHGTSDNTAVLSSIVDAFSSVGVSLDIAGELPNDNEVANVFTTIIREATTNAVKHAQASLISATMRETSDGVELVVTNDGIALGGPVKEGTGLAGMRYAASTVGGSFRFLVGPPFTLWVTVPKKGEET